MAGMNPEIKAQWVEALRSGEYQQCQGKLGVPAVDGEPEAYCCLGVLSDLAAKAGVIDKRIGSGNFVFWSADDIFGEMALLPRAVRDWSGIDDMSPRVAFVDEDFFGNPIDREEPLASLNDNGKTFREIADLIDAQL